MGRKILVEYNQDTLCEMVKNKTILYKKEKEKIFHIAWYQERTESFSIRVHCIPTRIATVQITVHSILAQRWGDRHSPLLIQSSEATWERNQLFLPTLNIFIASAFITTTFKELENYVHTKNLHTDLYATFI